MLRFVVCVALLAAVASASTNIVLPPGVTIDMCKGVECGPGMKCVERPNTNCIFMPCLNRTACIPASPFVFPGTGGFPTGRCPAPSGFGICANNCQRDSDCKSAEKCCRNGCGATVCTQAI